MTPSAVHKLHPSSGITGLFLVTVLFFFFSSEQATAANWYVDPARGNINNLGTQAEPWSTLSEVFAAGKIKCQYTQIPYNASNPVLLAKNPTGVVQAGDTIYLFSGYHGALSLNGWRNRAKITIKAASSNKPTISKINMWDCHNWIFDGLTISPEHEGAFINNGHAVAAAIVTLEDHGTGQYRAPNGDVIFRNCDVHSISNTYTWSASEWRSYVKIGFKIYSDRSVIIEDNNIYNTHVGAIHYRGSCVIKNNRVKYYTNDGFQSNGDNVTFDGNYISDAIIPFQIDNFAYPSNLHPDGIMVWPSDFATPIRNVVIRNNKITHTTDYSHPLCTANTPTTTNNIGKTVPVASTQGVLLAIVTDVLMENNFVVIHRAIHGLSVKGGVNVIWANNTVLNDDSHSWSAAIISTDCIYTNPDGSLKSYTFGHNNKIVNNITNRIVYEREHGVVENHHNIELPFSNYSDHFINWQVDGSLKSTSTAVNAASTTFAPGIDITGAYRDSQPDIGAYEYKLGTALL